MLLLLYMAMEKMQYSCDRKLLYSNRRNRSFTSSFHMGFIACFQCKALIIGSVSLRSPIFTQYTRFSDDKKSEEVYGILTISINLLVNLDRSLK